MSEKSLLESAIKASEFGRIFPCGGDKKPLIKEWQKRASKDVAQLQKWFGRPFEGLRIGQVAGGEAGDTSILDVDAKFAESHPEAFQRLRENPGTYAYETPGGGIHLHYRVEGEEDFPTCAGDPIPGIDWRGSGKGYVIRWDLHGGRVLNSREPAPARGVRESILGEKAGKREVNPPPGEGGETLGGDSEPDGPSLAEKGFRKGDKDYSGRDGVPQGGSGSEAVRAALLERVKESRRRRGEKVEKRREKNPDELGLIPEGKRNEELFKIACSWREAGAGEKEIAEELRKENFRCSPPLGEEELKAIAGSACRYPSGLEKSEKAFAGLVEMRNEEGGYRDGGAIELASPRGLWAAGDAYAGDEARLLERMIQARDAARSAEKARELIVQLRKLPKGLRLGKAGLLELLDAHPAVGHCWRDELRSADMVGREELSEGIAFRIAAMLEGPLGIPIDKMRIFDCLEDLCARRPIDSMKLLMEAEPWDGERRVERLFQEACGARDGEYERGVARLLFGGLAARTYRPGCRYDWIIILEGPQGCGKTSLWNALFGRHFAESSMDIHADEFISSLGSHCVLGFGDLKGLPKREWKEIKGVLSRVEDVYRPKYARKFVHRPRRCIFVADTNEMEYLDDATGNRRFLPISFGRDLRFARLEWVREHRLQLFAEAREIYMRGERWWSVAESAEARIQQSVREMREEDEPEIIEYALKHPEGFRLRHLCLELKGREPDRREEMRIGRILRMNGFEMKRMMKPGTGAEIRYWFPFKKGSR